MLHAKPTAELGPETPQALRIAYGAWLAVLGVFIAQTLLLRGQGRLWWCGCGQWYPWVSDVWSSHCSQHLADAYTLTHMLHGMLFCGLFAWLAPRVPVAWRLAATLLAEASWELLENSQWIIDRYREATAAVGYSGDSIGNSLGDTLACALGFFFARWLGFRWSVAVFLVTELVLLYWIHDNLVLNILMLLHSFPEIKAWQMGK